jgi:hypothetical protein
MKISKTRLVCLEIAALLIPLSVQATPITWQFSGSITEVLNPGPNLPEFANVGSPYNLSVTFDPSSFAQFATNCTSSVTSNCFGGYGSASAIAVRMSVDFGQDCEPGIDGYQACESDLDTTLTRAQVFLFNDFAIPGLNPEPADRIGFVLYPDGFGLNKQRWNFGLGGSTSIFDSATSGLPSTLSPDERFTFQELRVCQQCGQCLFPLRGRLAVGRWPRDHYRA